MMNSTLDRASETVVHVESRSPLGSNVNTLSGGQRSSLITNYQNTLLKGHQDIVTTIVCIDSPFRGGIVSADRGGAIKVWKVDNADTYSSFLY